MAWIELGANSVERLQRIKQVILEEPRRFLMEMYYHNIPDRQDGDYSKPVDWFQDPLCGTAACICGWANILRLQDMGIYNKAKYREESSNESAALEWLGIRRYDDWTHLISNSNRLFYTHFWPSKFHLQYRYAASPQEAAQAAADYIDWICSGSPASAIKQQEAAIGN